MFTDLVGMRTGLFRSLTDLVGKPTEAASSLTDIIRKLAGLVTKLIGLPIN